VQTANAVNLDVSSCFGLCHWLVCSCLILSSIEYVFTGEAFCAGEVEVDKQASLVKLSKIFQVSCYEPLMYSTGK
jgi:hypothetical protein